MTAATPTATPLIYLDHAASMPPLSEAVQALTVSVRRDFANPTAAHSLGREMAKLIDEQRSRILAALGVSTDWRLCFTSCATEANNLIIAGLRYPVGASILFSSAEHPSLVEPVRRLSQQGIYTAELPLTESGHVDTSRLPDLLGPTTRLVVLSHVNNHVGTEQNLSALVSIIREQAPRCHIHVDASQSFCKVPQLLGDLAIDSVSISAHKMGGIKGVAALALRNEVLCHPMLLGGAHENGLRSGTPATPLILSFAAAVAKRQRDIAVDYDLVASLKQLFIDSLRSSLPKALFPCEDACLAPNRMSPYIVLFIIPGVSSDIVMRHLEVRNIIIASSAACSAKKKGERPELSALKIPKHYHDNVLRVSFSWDTSREDVLAAANSLVAVLKELQDLKLI